MVGHASCTPSFIRHAIKSSKDHISHAVRYSLFTSNSLSFEQLGGKKQNEPPVSNRLDRKKKNKLFANSRNRIDIMIRGCIELRSANCFRVPRPAILHARILFIRGTNSYPEEIPNRDEREKKKILIKPRGHVILESRIQCLEG